MRALAVVGMLLFVMGLAGCRGTEPPQEAQPREAQITTNYLGASVYRAIDHEAAVVCWWRLSVSGQTLFCLPCGQTQLSCVRDRAIRHE